MSLFPVLPPLHDPKRQQQPLLPSACPVAAPGPESWEGAAGAKSPQPPDLGEGALVRAPHVRNYSCKVPVSCRGGRAPALIPAHGKGNTTPLQQRLTCKAPTSPYHARQTRNTGKAEGSTASSPCTVFHNLSFHISPPEGQWSAGADTLGDPRVLRDGPAAAEGGPGYGVTSPGLVPPSLGPVVICSFPRNSLSLAGAPRAADAPRSQRQGGFAV